MISWRWLVAYGCATLFLTSCNSPKSAGEIGKLAGESVVFINYTDQAGHGTGFFILGEKEVCTVITARHVVLPSAKLQLQTKDQKIWKSFEVKRFNKQDLAVITFKPNAGSCPYQPLKLGNSDKVNLGDKIYIIGFPGTSLGKQFVSGEVSLIDSQTEGYGISYTAITAGGMSGGPVINTIGEVVAVHGRTDIELARASEIKGEDPPPQQQSTKGASSKTGDAVGTFKWGIPINTYVANIAEARTDSQIAQDFVNEGNDLGASKRYKEAIASYDKAIALKPDDADAWYGRGFALNELQRYSDALVAYDKAIALNPDHADAWYNRGIALDDLQRYSDAVASYDKAITLNPDHAGAWNNRGIALRKLQRYSDAVASYDKAIALKPDHANAWYGRGFALDELQRYSDAVASYDKAIALKPDNADAWLGRGLALRKLQRYSDAVASYDKAIALKPDNASAWNNRGYALELLKRNDEALESYNKAIKFDPNYQKAINNRKELLVKLWRTP
ncbi:hypothetical protein BV372_25530 [Nostoc sp. T09]|uniref:tetratricopeptide repeat-containing S1 family peptidase n=1 Tax=Nostoc sp. T09 TaxID=1932621 RepID=UPI000B703CE8|nr:tetratricopeptide repeat-containing serine protease family protein [Nostoc sp. T09]OUL27673.1 hypothetical protein BV372_25530 [Nostoc sp. T09]